MAGTAFCVAPGAVCACENAEGGFRVSLSVDLGRDLGQNIGTLFEAIDDDGKPLAGAGFLGAYNTQDRSDRRLVHFYVKVKAEDGDFLPDPIPRPSSDSGTYLFGFDNRLYSFGRSGADTQLRQWDPKLEQWQIDTSTVPLSIDVEQDVLSTRQREIQHAKRLVLTVPPGEGLVAEPYYAGGFFFFRLRQPDATPEGNELLACAWAPGQAESIEAATGIRLPLNSPREFVYAYGQLGNQILAATNTGGVYVFDRSFGKWSTLRVPNGVSFQVYAATNYEDRLLLGQYPTGELFEFDGTQLRHLPDQPPVMPGVSPHAREAQTLAIYGGDLYAGVWPWGEVWRLDRRASAWRFLGRMFTHPAPTAETTHPYENESKKLGQVLNHWGQRVTSLVPHGDSLYIATSSKGGTPYEAKFGFLSDIESQEYGAVYRYRKPGSLAAPFEWRTGVTTFEFVHDGSRLAVYQDGRQIGAAECKLPAIDDVSRVVWGKGVFGPLAGKIESHELTKLAGATPSGDQVAAATPTRQSEPVVEAFLAAYVNMGRCFDFHTNVGVRESAIDDHLDRAVRVGLNAIIPYANTSSWSVNYPSELVTRKTFGEWDPLAKFVAGARQRGLSVWPAICVCSSGHFEPKGILIDHPEWAIRDLEGKPLGFISPSHPQARKWLVSVLREIVRKYQPDGVLLDYLRYFNRPWQLDERSQSALDERLAADSTSSADQIRRKEQHIKEDHLTQLAREISEALRSEKPNLKIAIYSWGPHVAHDHCVAQDWPTWVKEGYVDMVNISGYCYPGQYGEKYLEIFESRLRQSTEFAAQTGKSIPVSFALGVETSHGKVNSACDIERYLKAARRAGVNGTALFTWSTAQPYLDELTKSGALGRFAKKAAR
jgi:uncharacterized lipoprotein YddW (UPF0748 family)